MSNSGSNTAQPNLHRPNPHWLLAELTYKCPLQCPYCSNPVDIARVDRELGTDDWKRVFPRRAPWARSNSVSPAANRWSGKTLSIMSGEI